MDKLSRLRRSADAAYKQEASSKKKSITHVLNSPRRHFTRSKSKDRIETKDTIRRRKSKREGPASETRFKSEGYLTEHFAIEYEAEPFTLKATAVNSMPQIESDHLAPSDLWRSDRKKKTRKKAVKRDMMIEALNARISALEMENKKLEKQRAKETEQIENLKSTNATHLKQLKEAGVHAENDSRKEALGNLGRVSVYSQFAAGGYLTNTNAVHNDRKQISGDMLSYQDISYIDRDTLENMCRMFQTRFTDVSTELKDLKSIHNKTCGIMEDLHKDLTNIVQPQAHQNNQENKQKSTPPFEQRENFSSNWDFDFDSSPLGDLTIDTQFLSPRPKHAKLIFSTDGKSTLRYGDIGDIFEWVTERSHEPRDLEVFFTNYRQFITSMNLLNIIESRCEIQNWAPESVRTALQTLTYWTNEYPEDFQPLDVAEQLESFLQRDAIQELPFKVRMVRMQLRMCREKANSIYQVQELTLQSLGTPNTHLDLLSISPVELARQFTLLEFTMFQTVDPLTLLTQKSRDSNPHIKSMIQRFNRVSCWVATEVLLVSNIKKRASVIKHFIVVAQACREIRNFNTLLEITAGLNFSVIQRLRKTWKLVPSKYTNAFKRLEELMDCKANFIRYRQVLKASDLPCLPYFGIFLRDCSFIDVGNETFNEAGLVNFEKLKLKSDAIRLLKRYQEAQYHFPVIHNLQNYLQNLSAFEDSVLQKYSIQYERAAEV